MYIYIYVCVCVASIFLTLTFSFLIMPFKELFKKKKKTDAFHLTLFFSMVDAFAL